jgi:hypothetical protein
VPRARLISAALSFLVGTAVCGEGGSGLCVAGEQAQRNINNNRSKEATLDRTLSSLGGKLFIASPTTLLC